MQGIINQTLEGWRTIMSLPEYRRFSEICSDNPIPFFGSLSRIGLDKMLELGQRIGGDRDPEAKAIAVIVLDGDLLSASKSLQEQIVDLGGVEKICLRREASNYRGRGGTHTPGTMNLSSRH
jgi:hypothetical protein